MKKALVFLTLLFLVVFSSHVRASLQSVILAQIEKDGPTVWGIDDSNLRFVPDRGGIKVCKAEKKNHCRILSF